MDRCLTSRHARKRLCRALTTWSAVVSIALFGLANVHAQLPVSDLRTIFPPGGKQGASVDVQISGADLDGPTSLLFSHPGITAAPKMEEAGPLVKTPRPLDNLFSVNIAPETPPGIYEVRAVGRFGASNPRTFVVGLLDETRDNGNNRTPATAQELPVDVVVSGTTEGDSIDYYKLTLQQGQRVLVDCWARRIDSRMDATLVLLDEQGNELERVREAGDGDALLDFTAPANGAYLVGVHDFLYRGSPEFFYRLRVHTGPKVEAVFPPSAEPGKPTKLTVYGRNLPGGQPAGEFRLKGRALEKLEVDVTLPTDEAARRQAAVTAFQRPYMGTLDLHPWQLSSPQGAADPVPVAFAVAPVVPEQEPNDQPLQVNRVAAPCEYVGQFYPADDRDWVEFEAKKGDVYWIEVVAHRLGFDCDPYVLIQKVTKNEKGEEQVSDVVQMDDLPERNAMIGAGFDLSTDDPTLRVEAPEDALYRIRVQDQFGGGRSDPRVAYRLIIRRPQPDFRMVAAPEPAPTQNDNLIPQYASVLRRGGTALVQVRVERQDGFDGEVELSAEGLPQGVTCAGAVVGGQVKDAWLVFSADENSPAWTGHISIVGKTKVGGQEIVRYARPETLVWGTQNRQQDPPIARLARDLVLSVVDKETGPALVKMGDGAVVETSKGGKVEIPISVAWRGQLKGDLALAPIGAPNEFQVKNFNLKPGQVDGKMEFVLSNNNIQAGTYTFYLRGSSKIDYERNPDLIKSHEERQKEIDQTIAEFQEKAKQAGEAKTKAMQAAQEAMNVVKQKEQAVQSAQAGNAESANQELAQARAQLQTAEAAKTQAEADDRTAQELVKQATERKKQIDNQLNEIKKNNQKKEINVFVASTPVKVRVTSDPIQPTLLSTPTLKQGEKAEVAFTVNRLYGFDDQVEILFEPPNGVAGISAAKFTLPKGQNEGKIEVTAANNATIGEHTVNVRFRVRFNNVQLDEVVPLGVKIEMAPPK
jgi:hypothetical protein